ncbi:MAG: cell division protein FtsA [Candidatus Omnitrophota bacterium]
MKERFICGLDVGTAKLCAVLGMLNSAGKLDVLAACMLPAYGIDAGKIKDSAKLCSCIREICSRLSKMSGKKIKKVCVNIDSMDLKVKACRTNLSFDRRVRITRGRIDKLLSACFTAHNSPNRKIIHSFFNNFILDGETESEYPAGLLAGELAADIVLVSESIPTVDSLIECVTTAGLALAGLLPSSCAQALSLLKDGQERKSCVLVDVGAALIKAAFLKGNAVRDIAILPGGAGNITRDIAAKLNVSWENAERLKIEYGCALAGQKAPGDKIIVKNNPANRIISSQELNAVISARVDGLLRELKDCLLNSQYKDEDADSFIFTGGGAVQEGFLERAEQILGRNVRLGILSAVQKRQIQTQSAFYSTSIGLAQYGLTSKNNRTFPREIKFGCLQGLVKNAEGLYREYF